MGAACCVGVLTKPIRSRKPSLMHRGNRPGAAASRSGRELMRARTAGAIPPTERSTDPVVLWKAPDATDLAAVDESCIAVTPLKLDMTDKPYMTRLADLFE